jgi:hypothetical protein
MDQAQWAHIVAALRLITRSMKVAGQRPKYSDLLIAKLYIWSVAHERPVGWAAKRENLNRRYLRPKQLPSVSQLNRRVACDSFQLLLQKLHEQSVLSADLSTLCIDGRALCVSPVSQDRDARSGHIAGGMGKGYKLHAVVSADQKIPVFTVIPLNRHEMPIARRMLDCSPSLVTHGTRVLADGNYDAHVLHKDIARRGGWLITRPRGRARHPVTRRQMGSSRRQLIDLWDQAPQLMELVYRERLRIERVFGNLTSTPGLLGPLPAFVRGLPRVRRWVGTKICLYHARRAVKMKAKAAA